MTRKRKCPKRRKCPSSLPALLAGTALGAMIVYLYASTITTAQPG